MVKRFWYGTPNCGTYGQVVEFAGQARDVVATAVDWASAFSRTDPTLTITKFVNMGVCSSLINIIIEFIEERKMSVKFNSAESKLHTLISIAEYLVRNPVQAALRSNKTQKAIFWLAMTLRPKGSRNLF